MYPRARDKVLICCHSSSTVNSCPLFLSLFSPCYEISSNEFPSSDNRPDSGSHPSGTLAFIVLMGLSEGHLTLFHLQMLTDPALALITPQAWPFYLHQWPCITRHTTDEKLPRLPWRRTLHYPGRAAGPPHQIPKNHISQANLSCHIDGGRNRP